MNAKSKEQEAVDKAKKRIEEAEAQATKREQQARAKAKALEKSAQGNTTAKAPAELTPVKEATPKRASTPTPERVVAPTRKHATAPVTNPSARVRSGGTRTSTRTAAPPAPKPRAVLRGHGG